MENNYKWKKGLLSTTYKLYSAGRIIGRLKGRSFSLTADAEINDKDYTFKTEGVFKQRAKIIDNKTNAVIGEISYNNWMTKADLLIRDEKSVFKYENLWNSKWSICRSGDRKIKYSGSPSKGQIDSTVDDELLLLSGLFVTNYYWQLTMAIILIFIFIAALG